MYVYLNGLSHLQALKYTSGLFNKICGKQKLKVWGGKMNTFPRPRKPQKHIILKNTDQKSVRIL